MFPLINRNIPDVEHEIVSYLGPRDLVRAKIVSKKWHSVIKRYINYLKVYKCETIKCMQEEAFLKQVNCFANIELPGRELAITVSDKNEVYILGDESILHFDILNMCFKPELTFLSSGPWRYERRHTTLSVSDDGEQFTIKQFMLSSNFWWPNGTYSYNKRSVCGHSSLVLQQPDISNCIATTAIPSIRASTPTLEDIHEFCSIFRLKPRTSCHLNDIVWLQYKRAAIFALSASDQTTDIIQSNVFGIRLGGRPRLLAKVPIDPVQLHVIGTRVLCYRKTGILGKMIVFDVWNPDSVRQGDINMTDVHVHLGVKGEHSNN